MPRMRRTVPSGSSREGTAGGLRTGGAAGGRGAAAAWGGRGAAEEAAHRAVGQLTGGDRRVPAEGPHGGHGGHRTAQDRSPLRVAANTASRRTVPRPSVPHGRRPRPLSHEPDGRTVGVTNGRGGGTWGTRC